VNVISKREHDGIMVVDREACLGAEACGQCKDACPYALPQFSKGEDDKMQMCTFCVERIEKGVKPVCVDACPMRALDSGPLAELKKKYGAIQTTDGFTYSPETKPSIVVKPRY
jgi:anaerobic dimethyl sulfoxide reductase subunit B (iron-sulfur subunit)